MTPSARLLAQSLLAIACGAAACGDDERDRGSGNAPDGLAAGMAGSAGTGAGSGRAVASSGGAAPGGSGGKARPSRACLDGAPLLVDGVASGMVKCLDGSLARTASATCLLRDLSALKACPDPSLGGAGGHVPRRCHDPCLETVYGRPKQTSANPDLFHCEYFCATDADCPVGRACACDEEGIGRCLQGECSTATECGADASCRVRSRLDACGGRIPALFCVDAEEECATDADCEIDYPCVARHGKPDVLRCGGGGKGGCGRPILVARIARLAPLVREPWAPLLLASVIDA